MGVHSSSPLRRPCVLLDIDHTVLFGLVGELEDEEEMKLNYPLLEALKAKGIMDIFFFTDMNLNSYCVKERQTLVELLQLPRFGFRVHGVITPADVAYHISSGEAEILESMLSSPGYTGKYFGAEFESLILSKAVECPGLVKACSTYFPLQNFPGKVFKDALSGSTDAHFLSKTRVAKMLADHLSEKYRYAHTKGLMLDLFLHHRPEWVDPTKIVVCDDNDKVIETVRDFHRALVDPNAEGLSTLLMVPIPKEGFNKPSSFYEKFLAR